MRCAVTVGAWVRRDRATLQCDEGKVSNFACVSLAARATNGVQTSTVRHATATTRRDLLYGMTPHCSSTSYAPTYAKPFIAPPANTTFVTSNTGWALSRMGTCVTCDLLPGTTAGYVDAKRTRDSGACDGKHDRTTGTKAFENTNPTPQAPNLSVMMEWTAGR